MPDVRDEKEEEKRHEKQDEKQFDEKWRNNPLSVVIFAVILIWAGLVLLADNAGLLVRLEGMDAGKLIAAGAGLLLLLEVVIRLVLPQYRRPVVGTAILGVILILVGLEGVRGWDLLWPVALIAAGIVLMLGYFFRRR